MEGRLVAEEQQRKLKHAVETRAKVMEEIAAVVKERSDAPKRDQLAIEQKNELSADDAVLFEEFLHDLDVIYAQTDEVFRACGVEEMPQMSYRQGPERKCDGDTECIDKLDVLFVPFSFEQTCSTMWQSMLHVYRQRNRFQYGHVADPYNTVAVKQEFDKPVDMLVHCVMRRYIEAERMVVVWRALTQGEGELFGMHSDETGWCVVRPNDEELDDTSLMRTVMQTFVRFVPMNVANRSAGHVDGFQFTKLVNNVIWSFTYVDEAFLAGLLDDYESLEPSIGLPHEDSAPDLILTDSDELLAETDALLASVARSESGAQKTKAAKRRLKYETKIKNERKTLQEEEKALLEQLQEMQRTRKKVKSLGDKSSAVPLWKAIATRQMEGRVVAQEQQKRLKRAIENRVKVIEEMHEMARKSSDESAGNEL
ncbi:hypothetical protein PHYSODRAFT_389535, partial [Phytophthora sojae]